MLRGLITGILHDDPARRTSAGGSSFTTAKLKDDSETPPAWYSVIGFGEIADSLAARKKGDSLAVAGRMTVKLYTGRDGNVRIDSGIVADQISTLRRKKKPSGAAPEHREEAQDRGDEPICCDDDISF